MVNCHISHATRLLVVLALSYPMPQGTVLVNPENIIYDIGTEILMFHCFATKMLKSFCKSIIFSGIESSRRDLAFYSIKTRFKALFKN